MDLLFTIGEWKIQLHYWVIFVISSMYQLDKADSSHSELKKCFTINLGQEGQEPPPGTITTTTSGRHVRRISLGSMLQMDAELPNLVKV